MRGRWAGWAVWGLLPLVAAAVESPYELDAGRLDYTNGLLVASGGVTGRFDRAWVRAERMEANPELGDLWLEGDVFFERDGLVWSGDRLRYNYQTEVGSFGPVRMAYEEARVVADRVERQGEDSFVLRGASMTTCRLERPHYSFYAPVAQMDGQRRFTARHVRVRVGGVPVLYLPILKGDLSQSGLGIEAGYRGSVGAFVKLGLGGYEGEGLQARSRLHLYSKRGVGVEQSLAWRRDDSVWELDGFYLQDQRRYERYDALEERGEIDASRFRGRLLGDDRFSDRSYLMSSWTVLSDRYVVEEFFRDEFRRMAQPETRSSLVMAGERGAVELYASQRLNDFYGNTDRLEAAWDGYRQRLWGGPFFYEGRSSLAYLEQRAEEGSLADENEAFRVLSDHGVYVPVRWGALAVVPRAEFGWAHYSQTALGDADERMRWALGAEASVQARRVLSSGRGWYGEGLRHVVRPYVDYQVADYSWGSERLIGFDVADELDDQHRVRVGLNQLLQTRREGGTRRLAEIDLYTHYLVDEVGATNSFDRVFGDARLSLTDRLRLDGLAVLDANEGRVPLMISRARYGGERLGFSVEHFWREGAQSLYTGRLDLFPKERYSAEAYVRVEEETGDVESASITLFAERCCMRFGLGYRLSRNDEHTVRFSVNLAALAR